MSALCALRLPEGKSSLYESRCIDIIDCLQLPHNIVWHTISNTVEAFEAIKSMKIRGAPAIASLAAVAIACELLNILDEASHSVVSSTESLSSWLEERSNYLLSSRPTAVNLREAMHRLQAISAAQEPKDPRAKAQRIVNAAELVWTEDVARNVLIGDHGAQWLLKNLESEGAIQAGEQINVLTVCNTGSLATSGYGTALGVITSLFRKKRLSHAFFAQTGPYQQGARLTSLELQSQQIPCTMVPDTAMASLLAGNAYGKNIHAFILGADRIAANGDTANKISSYQIALLAHHVPPPKGKSRAKVLVCAPVATFDLNMDSGEHIVIEERPSWEACTVRGKVYSHEPNAQKPATSEATAVSAEQQVDAKKQEVVTVLVTPEGTNAWNPAFDVTPAMLVDGVACELGVAEKAKEGDFTLREYVKNHKAEDKGMQQDWTEAEKAGGANGVKEA